LLGLGSKFIVTPSKTTGGPISKTLDRLQRDFYIRIYYAGGQENGDTTFVDHDKAQRSKLYVKSTWNPTERDVSFWALLSP
jgi:hypothetical protein